MLNIKLQPNEAFVPVKGYETLYWVSNLGRVANARMVMKTFIQNGGYEVIKLTTGGKGNAKHFTLHRLVATHFIPNTLNLAEVNHIDGDKLNNRQSNLEWVTPSQNKLHALATGLKVYNLPTKGKRLGKTSRYRNVTKYPRPLAKPWRAAISSGGKVLGAKCFATELEAAKHVNWIIDTYNLDRPHNVV